MSMFSSIAVQSAMDELLKFYEEISEMEQDRFEAQLNMLLMRIRDIECAAEAGYY